MSLFLHRSGILKAAAGVAFPVVEGTATFNDLSNPVSITLPSGITSGELLLMLISLDSSSSNSITTPSGWTQLYHVIGSTNLRRAAAYYREADGTEGSTVSVSADNNARWAANTYRISGAGVTPEADASASGEDSQCDPASLTPSWGSTKTLWIAAAHYREVSLTFPSLPTNYSDAVEAQYDDGGNQLPGLVSGRRELEASSENPGTFSTTLNDWVGATIAIEPA